MPPSSSDAAPVAFSLLTGKGRQGAAVPTRVALFLAWLVAAAWLAAVHVVWRDEVRAYSLALSGDSVWAMLRAVHGEGHPALWYLLLRFAHGVTGRAAVLPGLGFVIGAAAAALWAWRAPFRGVVLGAALAGGFFVYEYVVVARNYGIGVLLMFAFAVLYPRWRERGVGLGMLLALLANTNVPCVLLAGALGLFWGVDVLAEDGWRWTPAWRRWVLNMAIALAGVGLCVAEVYPPFNDAAVSPLTGQGAGAVFKALINLPAPFSSLVPETWWAWRLTAIVLAAMVVGSPLGLVRSPAGLIAALAALLMLPTFFHLVYPGSYRHQALYVCFLLTVYWLVADGAGGRWPDRVLAQLARIQTVALWGGQFALLALLVTQVAVTPFLAMPSLIGIPASRSSDLAALLRREGLGRAALIAYPDVMLEPLPYYADNPIWLVREQRWGRTAAFTKAAARDLHLSDILSDARRLQAHTRRPIVIVMELRLDQQPLPEHWQEGYLGTLATPPGEVWTFLASTRRIARFAPATTDESYDVYLLKPPVTAS